MTVYVIGCGEDGPLKVGFTRGDATGRLYALQTAHHEPLRVVAEYQGDVALERRIHERLAAYRLNGEWFENSPEVLKIIDEVAADYEPPAGGNPGPLFVPEPRRLIDDNPLAGLVPILAQTIQAIAEKSTADQGQDGLIAELLERLVNENKDLRRRVDILERIFLSGVKS